MTIHTRRSVRLPGFDYSSAGAYSVTLVTASRLCVFGCVAADHLQPSVLGQVVEDEWLATPSVRPGVTLGAFVVMPNHLHAIVWFPLTLTEPIQENSRTYRRTLGNLIAGFKSVVTRRHRDLVSDANAVVWQRGFYEHVIRDETDLNAIEAYIEDNPKRWAEDAENPMAQ